MPIARRPAEPLKLDLAEAISASNSSKIDFAIWRMLRPARVVFTPLLDRSNNGTPTVCSN
jgi:hypothetical protein